MRRIIEIRGLDFLYPDGTHAVKGINFDLFQGDSVAIIGRNGAGKSTLLLHLNGLLTGKGVLNIIDKPVCQENIDFIRQKVGFVFQDPPDQLFMPTVYEDVAFGPRNLGWSKERIERQVEYALGEVGLRDKKKHLSHHLSLGEQKRVSIATVLSMSPEILVLDEPSSNLDSASRRHLIELLRGLKVSKIIATHDLEMVLDICRRVVLLDNGMVVVDGETEKILSDKELLESYGLEVPLSLSLKNRLLSGI